MGTRGLYGFRYKGRYILFYNHWDSYCDGLGQKILDELRKFTEADYDALEALLKNHLRNQTLKEGTEGWEGECFEGLMKAAQNPETCCLQYVEREIPRPDLFMEYTYIVDLNKSFLRVITHNDKFKFPLHDLPRHMGGYDEERDSDVDTNLSDDDEDAAAE